VVKILDFHSANLSCNSHWDPYVVSGGSSSQHRSQTPVKSCFTSRHVPALITRKCTVLNGPQNHIKQGKKRANHLIRPRWTPRARCFSNENSRKHLQSSDNAVSSSAEVCWKYTMYALHSKSMMWTTTQQITTATICHHVR